MTGYIGAGAVGTHAPSKGVGRLLFDDFERANTTAGSLGSAPTGQTWDLRGPYVSSYPLPASAYGQITSGAYVVPGGQIVYAGALLPKTPKTMKTEYSWSDKGSGTQFTTFAMICSNSEANWIDNMLHITWTHASINIQKRVAGGPFVTMNTGATVISPSGALGGAHHNLRLDIVGPTVRVRIDSQIDISVTDADIPLVVGKRVVFEHYTATPNVRWPLSIHTVEVLG